jgi:hypothetical protein
MDGMMRSILEADTGSVAEEQRDWSCLLSDNKAAKSPAGDHGRNG